MLATALNLLFPPQCLSCREQVSTHGTLCTNCWNAISFISAPFCERCGLPFEFGLGDGAHCAECLRVQPPFARARAVFRYDEASSALIKKLKYNDETLLAATFCPWLLQAGRELIAVCDTVVPVPLYYWRYVRRRYNQASLLAGVVAKTAELAFLPDALLRTRSTAPQTGLTRKERAENIEGAFSINPRLKERIKNRRILLVDDVFTTGVTLSACAEVLLEAGAGQVCALTLARRV